MRLWKMEFYKIAARPVMNIGFLLLTGFFLLVIWQEADGARTEIDGKVYQGLEAVQKDRQLAKEYEGVFTMEKAKDIVKRFGFSGYIAHVEGEVYNIREGNFCSQFVTDHMTDFFRQESGLWNFPLVKHGKIMGKNMWKEIFSLAIPKAGKNCRRYGIWQCCFCMHGWY